MRDRLDDLGAATSVAMVTFAGPAVARAYGQRQRLPFPVLIDPDRGVYGAYGLGRGSVFRVWGWRAARRYIDMIRRDGPGGLQRPTDDTLQLGGDFVIGPTGALVWGHWGEGPDDRPSMDAVVAAVRRARSETGPGR